MACGFRQERDICAKCCQGKEIVATCVLLAVGVAGVAGVAGIRFTVSLTARWPRSDQELASERLKRQQELEAALDGMRERERRAFLRSQDKDKRAARGDGDGDEDNEGDDGFESFDEEDEEM